MCGIFGFYARAEYSPTMDDLADMGDLLRHRGPDGRGSFYDEAAKVGLGNQRLAIIDVEHGAQPFYSDDRSVVVVQNGEIFNHVELAEVLSAKGVKFDTHCDTEVILRLYEAGGIKALESLNGMFAIAIYDRNEDAMFLFRDRVGEKPLYYREIDGCLVFASEIKSMLNLTKEREVCPQALNQYLAFNFVPPPLTMFKGIFHVKPGHWLKVTRSEIKEVCWWDLSHVSRKNWEEDAFVEEFNAVLKDAVRIRLRSDVPFGAFLSGGVDSSTVVGLMASQMEVAVNTFSIGFEDPKYDETPFAEEAASRFSTNHKSYRVEPNLMSLWPKATYHCDQPHGDVSFLPTYKVASLAVKDVKMVLTGDGADELFAGYDKYKDFFGEDINGLSSEGFIDSYLKNISLFQEGDRESLFDREFVARVGCVDVLGVIGDYFQRSNHMDRINQALYLDMSMLLPGNNLVKPDRMGMAVSLEARAPFLDYRMMELAFSLDGSMKLRNGETKYIYKKAVAPLIGDNLAYRKKQMFTVPVGEWFKTDLKDLCYDLLVSNRTSARKIFDYKKVEHMLEEHISGRRNYTRQLRALMAIEVWFREVFEND